MKNRLKTRALLKNKKFLFEIAFFLVTLAVVVLCLSIVFRRGGWPYNHEGLAFKYRTEIYAEHIKSGDLFPVWASSDAYGMGSPLPLFYHKVFYYISATLLLVFGSVKLAIAGAIAILMLVGAYGMRFAIQKFSKEKVLILGGAIAFLLTNYVFTNWLVRGAMAEFSAMMIVPWLIWWCLNLVISKKFSLSIAIIMALLFYAHSAIALMSAIPVLIAYGIHLRSEKGIFKKTYKKALVSGAVLLAILSPGLILTKTFLGDYNPGKITEAGFKPVNNFQNVDAYLTPGEYSWLNDWQQYSIQIDYGLWVPLGALIAITAVLSLNPKIRRKLKDLPNKKVALFLTATLLVYIFLQLRLSKPVYENVSVLNFLQFPWRLLALMTPLLLLIIAFAASTLSKTTKNKVFPFAAAMLWMVPFILLSPLTHRFNYSFFDDEKFNNQLPANEPGKLNAALTGIGEYLPKVSADGRELSSLEVLEIYKGYYQNGNQIEVKQGGECTFGRDEDKTFESLQAAIRINCSKPSIIALPMSYSEQILVTDELNNNKKIDGFRYKDDPRLIVKLDTSKANLRIKYPTVVRSFVNLLK